VLAKDPESLFARVQRDRIRYVELLQAGRTEEALKLYAWFLPLLRFDTVPKFVQLIKLVQQEVGMGSERVRPPRQPIRGGERERVLALVRAALASNPLR